MLTIPQLSAHAHLPTLICTCSSALQVIGEVGLEKGLLVRHKHSAKARGRVTVVKLTEESFLKALVTQMVESGGVDDEAMLSMQVRKQSCYVQPASRPALPVVHHAPSLLLAPVRAASRPAYPVVRPVPILVLTFVHAACLPLCRT